MTDMEVRTEMQLTQVFLKIVGTWFCEVTNVNGSTKYLHETLPFLRNNLQPSSLQTTDVTHKARTFS
jgi:hypothetical protein